MRIQEIYQSLQGELPNLGRPCTIIRLAGCNLSCHYCDAQPEKPSQDLSIEEILGVIDSHENKEVLITGGEPLLQLAEVEELAKHIYYESDREVVIETNGTIAIPTSLAHCIKAMDVKLLPNGVDINLHTINNLEILEQGDVLKFVYWDQSSFVSAAGFVLDHVEQNAPYLVVFSPADYNNICFEEFQIFTAQRPDLDIRMQVQIHKTLNLG